MPADIFLEKELTLKAVRGPGPGYGDKNYELGSGAYPREFVRWQMRENMEVFLGLLAGRKVQIAPLVSDRLPIERAAAVYDKIERSPETILGAVLTA